MRKIYIVLFLLILIFVIITVYYNQNFIYHQLVSKPRIYFWSKRDNNAEKIQMFIKKFKQYKTSEGHFDSFKDNQIHNYAIPIFDKSLYIKKYIPNQFDPNLYGKEGGLPYIINMFTTPRSLFGTWLGDSIFRKDLKKRGVNNTLKEHYMRALKTEDLEQYRILFRDYFIKYFKSSLEVNYFDFVQETNINLTYLIHFKELPTKKDLADVLLFINTVRTYWYDNKYVDKQLFNLQIFHRRILKLIEKTRGKECLVGKWLKFGNFNKNDIFVEFIHNILGMAINWTNLMYSYILKFKKGDISPIPNDPTYFKPYLYETFRYLTPVRYTSSKILKPEMFGMKPNSNCMALHDLKIPSRMPEFFGNNTDKFDINRLKNYKKDTVLPKGRCPFFDSPKGAKVACDMELYEKEGYIVFGDGYRRCPGEHLSIIFLEEFAKYIKKIDFEIYQKNGETNLFPYIWSGVDKNLIFKIK